MPDPYFKNVSLQLRAKASNPELIDSSFINGENWINKSYNQNLIVSTTAIGFLNSNSFEFKNSIPVSQNDLYKTKHSLFRLGDFTIEFNFYLNSFNSGNSSVLLDCLNGAGYSFYVGADNKINYQESTNASLLSGGTIALNTKYHVAVSRINGQIKLFLNGDLLDTKTSTYDYYWTYAPSNLFIGGKYNVRDSFKDSNGYFDDLRITMGVGRYTTNFTIPTNSDFTEFNIFDTGGFAHHLRNSTNIGNAEYVSIKNNIRILNNKFVGFIKELTDRFGDNEFSGYASLDGVVGSYLVYLFDRITKKLIRITKSDENGYFKFTDLQSNVDYFIICEDYETKPIRKNAVVRDFIKL